jgi:hypothetical protein
LIKILNDTLYFVTVLLRESSSVTGRNTFIAIYPYAHYIFNASMTCSACRSHISELSYLNAYGIEITMEATEIAKEMKVARLMVVNNLALGP